MCGGGERCLSHRCSNAETWTCSCCQDMQVQDFSKSCWGNISILQPHLPLPSWLLFTHSGCAHTIWFRHTSDSRKSPGLGMQMEVSACSILVLISVPDVPVLFSQIFSPCICGAALGQPALPYKLLEGILELRTWSSYNAHRRHGERQCQGHKYSNTFKGLGWSQLDFFLSQQEVF